MKNIRQYRKWDTSQEHIDIVIGQKVKRVPNRGAYTARAARPKNTVSTVYPVGQNF